MVRGGGDYEEYIGEVIDLTMEFIEQAVTNFDETFRGVPFGAGSLDSATFVRWFEEQMQRQGPNWPAFLALEDAGEGRKALERYAKLRGEGFPSAFDDMAGAPVGVP